MTALARELELAEQAGRGDEAAIAELVNRALPTVRGLARRLTGNDEEGDVLAQDAILAAIEMNWPRKSGHFAKLPLGA